MSDATRSHRLDGLEPDNLLAFLALLGLMRALETDDRMREDEERLRPRLSWDVDEPPVRPRLHLADAVTQDEVTVRAASGLDRLASVHDFDGRKDLDYSQNQCRELLKAAVDAAEVKKRDRVDLLASLVSDAAIKADKDVVDATPLCLLLGQGHQHFLERLAIVPRQLTPPSRGRQKSNRTPAECLGAALFQPWTRDDATFSFRWDPEEDVRYALMAGDPTDTAYKSGTQHGANRLAAIGLACLTVVPRQQGRRVRAAVIGGSSGSGGFTFMWPVWKGPASLATIRAMLQHPDLRTPHLLRRLGIDHVMVTRRISVGKFMNFPRARPLFSETEPLPRTSISRSIA